MNIRLARPPTAISAPRFAADVASWVRRRFALELDYSVESLAKVDALLETMRQERIAIDDKVVAWSMICVPSTPDEFEKVQAAEFARVKKVIQDIGLKPQF